MTLPVVRPEAGLDTSRRRLRLLRILLIAIAVTIGARLVWLQTAQGAQYQQRAQAVQDDVVEVPAARGDIVDRNGVILAGNRTAFEVIVDPDVDADTLGRVAALTGRKPAGLRARMVACGQPGAVAGVCFQGIPGESVPVVTDVPLQQAMDVQDSRLPGVRVAQAPVRDYPSQANAAQMLGYMAGGVGVAGLEAQYEQALAGVPGEATRELTREGASRTSVTVQPIPGQRLVTALDADTQRVAEQALAQAVTGAQGAGYKATGGSVLVMDPRTGQVLALASYPTYDPNIWATGVTDAQYARLTDPRAGQPLLSRPIQALAPPASTFKSITTAAAVNGGFDLQGTYECPATVNVGGQTFRNYGSRAYGPVTLAQALSVSCDTVFYRLGYRMWRADGGLQAVNAQEQVVRTAGSFGFGARTGIDLPGEAAGSVPDRAQVLAEYAERKDDYCRRAEQGYPEEPDRARARLLKAYARDYCRSGDQYKAGDAMNTAIGQGRTLSTPIQVATAYAAIANGGTLVTPQVGVRLEGEQDRQDLSAAPRGRVDASPATLAYLRRALAQSTVTGTARGAFAGFPLDQYPVAAKTGTAEVAGKQSTSWFASFAPADDPAYVVVVNVDQGGLGAGTSGPVARAVYEHLFGITP